MRNLLLKSYAKINICLDITKKREDGYHELDMIMLPLEMHDSILFNELYNAQDHFVTIDDYSVGSLKYNLATSAIEKLQKVYKFKNKFRITIHKVIPMKAGLGGGSSNAATVMSAVNSYLNLKVSPDEMATLSKDLGADIPFFVYNSPARCTGIGEKIEFITVKNNYYVLICKPEQGCVTKSVYELSDTMELKHGNVELVKKALEEGDDELLAASIFNSLEEPAMALVPEIKVIKDKMKEEGLNIVLMSGSGSAVFALSTDKRKLKAVAKKLDKLQYYVEITKIKK